MRARLTDRFSRRTQPSKPGQTPNEGKEIVRQNYPTMCANSVSLDRDKNPWCLLFVSFVPSQADISRVYLREAMAGRTLIAKLHTISLCSRVLSFPLARPSPLLRFRPLLAAAASDYPLLRLSSTSGVAGLRCFSTRPTTSSLNDPSPNWSNRPPKETILLDGCDFEHWLVVMEPPDPALTRDEIIDGYIKTLAEVLGR
ncbi:hypothetical protein B296_00006938 [Ensete ventricosum]|uniref:MORF/ORRM1/DAG-like MORF domain-containing protein n=1 Tax=Ensete ventricosum TaxID=4639 RepID=A0A427B2M3_ENSVE|nr:hypothetical protein B296_00006938 [Ensete ventricosum]